MSEKGLAVHVSVKTERLDNPSMTEGRFVEVIFVITDKNTREGKGFGTFRLSADTPEMPRGNQGDLYYITQAQRFFKLCAEATLLDRPDLRSGDQSTVLIVSPLDERMGDLLNDE